MHKYIKERIESVHKALTKEWGEEFEFFAHREMSETNEGVAILETRGRQVHLSISKEYIFLVIPGVFESEDFTYEMVNEMNMASLNSKYTLDGNYITAETNFYTEKAIINSQPKLLTTNIRIFLEEIEVTEKAFAKEINPISSPPLA